MIQLVGDPQHVTIPVDPRSRALLGDTTPHRVVLDLEDVDVDHALSTVYAVYVNLPDDVSPGDATGYHAGNVSTFGIAQARSAVRFTFDITDLVAHLREQGRWNDDELDVTFRPASVQVPADSAEADAVRAALRHEDAPIRIDRIGVHVE